MPSPQQNLQSIMQGASELDRLDTARLERIADELREIDTLVWSAIEWAKSNED